MPLTETYIDELNKTGRIRWFRQGNPGGTVLILFVGIHGNEPAGLDAIDLASKKIDDSELIFNGSVYAIAGNLKAIDSKQRYLDTDLNRLWELYGTDQDFSILNGNDTISEYSESLDIKNTIEIIIEQHQDDTAGFVFADLHTTSARSCAFILLNDTLENRELARNFPVPQILGIEENIQGTLLSYINNLGYKAIGFEAGAHEDKTSVERSESFFWLLLEKCGLISLSSQEKKIHTETLRSKSGIPDTYFEIRHHQLIDDPFHFEMIEGFENFDVIKKDTPLAYDRGKLIKAPVSGRIFMPLYQKKGHDGFLIIREVSEFWLRLSAYLRKSFAHRLLKYLPGVKAVDYRSFEVNLNVAKFLVKDIFHLFGYRVTKKDKNTLICYRR
jgi:succinylglutamate desuccinylase